MTVLADVEVAFQQACLPHKNKIDVLINCAGATRPERFDEVFVEDLVKINR